MGIALSSCSDNTAYSRYQPVDRLGWNADSVLYFDIQLADTAEYECRIHVRHTSHYAYQNLWLLLRADSLETDTLELYLADQRGKWFGARRGANYELTVPLTALDLQTGRTLLSVRHGMRSLSLKDITDIGITVNRIDHGQE